jgi:hypothetical protein
MGTSSNAVFGYSIWLLETIGAYYRFRALILPFLLIAGDGEQCRGKGRSVRALF